MQNPNQFQAPNNIRSKRTGNIEIRKLWHVPEAKFFYALYVEFEQETAELVDGEPNWDNVTKETGWTAPQGYTGDEEWAARTAEHFGIEVPEEEYKGE